MRIVGGTFRGRVLRTPEGRGTRPTQDRVREAMASIVASAFDLDLAGLSVADPFAGSGAVGLELLSRGAARCTFVERDARAHRVLRDNIAALGVGGRAKAVRGDGLALASLDAGPFDVVVLDPPYAFDVCALTALVGELHESGALTPRALVIHQRARDGADLDAAALADTGLHLAHSRRFGETAVALWRYGGADAGEKEES